MNHLRNASGLLLLVFLTTGAITHEEEFISEASGVCRLGNSVVIAGDEEPNSFWVIADGSQRVETVEVKNGEWDDMEDLSAVDDRRFFAMTSHGRTKKGKLKPEREQLLLISKKTAHFAVEHSWSLRSEILEVLEDSLGDILDMETTAKASADEGGLNVEGLAFHDGHLFLGLRSPLTERGEAIVLRIDNANGLLDGDSPVFGEVAQLPLGKKGIRGLTSVAAGLLVIAGSSNNTDEDFSLHQWAPSLKKVKAFPLNDFKTLLRPEGLLVEKDGSVLFVQDFEEPTDQDVVVKLSGARP